MNLPLLRMNSPEYVVDKNWLLKFWFVHQWGHAGLQCPWSSRSQSSKSFLSAKIPHSEYLWLFEWDFNLWSWRRTFIPKQSLQAVFSGKRPEPATTNQDISSTWTGALPVPPVDAVSECGDVIQRRKPKSCVSMSLSVSLCCPWKHIDAFIFEAIKKKILFISSCEEWNGDSQHCTISIFKTCLLIMQISLRSHSIKPAHWIASEVKIYFSPSARTQYS